ncbi:hypothetical protein C8P63_1063 [Melghirimyces profundicolus]|uniref:Uncharacterized protein n=1 Tax=Melghirimyces profundicolus TaxID=1242148 RepID=A0A2T6C0A8_9BACL|nr:hypothetical protein [Melghirimyces profundicolus]PTX61751.1 hypothetical protein C8P63_1063 [Melghirimyces profundicolus]
MKEDLVQGWEVTLLGLFRGVVRLAGGGPFRRRTGRWATAIGYIDKELL